MRRGAEIETDRGRRVEKENQRERETEGRKEKKWSEKLKERGERREGKGKEGSRMKACHVYMRKQEYSKEETLQSENEQGVGFKR